MTKEEQIALELVKISDGFDETTWANYTFFLDKLKKQESIENNIKKLQDEIGTYKYMLDAIIELMKKDENNFVLKDDLEEILGGIINE